MKKENGRKKWLTYLSNEIGIEYKASLYFWGILFFDATYLLCNNLYSVSLLHIAEMISITYIMGYLQVYVFHNFDEATKLQKKEGISIVICSMIYGVVSYLFQWFNQSLSVSIIFICYFILIYILIYLINKIKRDIDTKQLNDMLNEYKKGGSE